MSESQSPARQPREVNEWIVCEEYGYQERDGECPIHHGDACLIVVAWVDNSHVRRDLAQERAKHWLAVKALEDAERNVTDERLLGVIRVTLENSRA